MATPFISCFRLHACGRGSSFARTSRQLQSISTRRLHNQSSQNQIVKQTALAHGLRRKQCSAKLTGNPIALIKYRQTGTTTAIDETPSISNKNATVEPYSPPTTGLISYLPSTWIPYAELIRLDKPAGTYYLFLPCLFSTLLAAPLTAPITAPSTVITTSLLFFSGALIMRGAGCTINDLWDRNLDPYVARTRNRPIARGAIGVSQAVPFLGAQLLCGLAVLLQFPFPQCFYHAVPSLLLVAAYPLAKRVTNYPQFVLGLTFSWGAIMGFPALGLDLLVEGPAALGAACLYASCVAWTVVYDMIYAYQDIKDDAKAGIKSIALAQEANAKIFLSAVSAVQVALLAGAGVAIGASPVYFVEVCGGAAATLGYMIRKVDLGSVRDCWAWFRRGAWFTGGAISLGLAAEYSVQYLGYTDRSADELLIETD